MRILLRPAQSMPKEYQSDDCSEKMVFAGGPKIYVYLFLLSLSLSLRSSTFLWAHAMWPVNFWNNLCENLISFRSSLNGVCALDRSCGCAHISRYTNNSSVNVIFCEVKRTHSMAACPILLISNIIHLASEQRLQLII